MVELSRFAAGEVGRLVDNPAPTVDDRFMQHGPVLCFKFQLESRRKLWKRQAGCDQSKRQFLPGALRGRFSSIGLFDRFLRVFDSW
jgi:hypothetical protein